MKVIVTNLQKSVPMVCKNKKAFEEMTISTERILKTFLEDVKMSSDFSGSSLSFETTTKIVENQLTIYLIQVFSVFHDACIEIPDENFAQVVP